MMNNHLQAGIAPKTRHTPYLSSNDAKETTVFMICVIIVKYVDTFWCVNCWTSNIVIGDYFVWICLASAVGQAT